MSELSAVQVPHFPPQLIYAGLFGCLVSLIVATWQQNWSLRVFFLLALRLAIGWHFAFEGLYKINSHLVGPAEGTKPFTSEPYFTVAEGPFGDYMRKKYLGDPAAAIAAKLTPPDDTPRDKFATLSEADQAAKCPKPAAEALDAGIPDAGKATSAKAAFARWVYGVDTRDASVKFVGSGPVGQSAADRLKQIAVMKKWAKELHEREAMNLGVGYGIEQKRAATARADVRTAESELAADADTFVADQIKLYSPKDAPPPPAPEKPIKKMDELTMWTLTIAGLCVLFGLFTPVACLVCAGFLVLTYLTHPAFPWYPLPPGTEGNPLFVNKNVIECLGLLVIAVHPTGRWLGLDAIWTRILFGK